MLGMKTVGMPSGKHESSVSGPLLAFVHQGVLRSLLPTKWVSHPLFADMYENLPTKHP